MATLSAFSSLPFICFAPKFLDASASLAFRNVHLHSHLIPSSIQKLVALKEQRGMNCRIPMVKVVEEGTQISQQVISEQAKASMSEQ